MRLMRNIINNRKYFSVWNSLSQHSIQSLLNHYSIDYRPSLKQIRVKECCFCPKPTYGRLDNMYTLIINKQTGLFYCHRCTSRGNHNQLSAKLSGVNLDSVDQLQGTGIATKADDLTYYSKYVALHSTQGCQVLKYLQEQRKITLQVLKKYKVGAGNVKFINQYGEVQQIMSMYFPTYRPTTNSQRIRTQKIISDSLKIDPTYNLNQCINNQNYALAKYKLRGSGKQFKCYMRQQPSGCPVGLFGLNLAKPHDEQIVITQGQIDAMSVHQVTGKLAVSLPMGAAHLPFHVLPFLSHYKTIYLWMDSDAAGLLNEPKLAQKLGLTRTKVIRLNINQQGIKDANDLLKLNKTNIINQCIQKAKTLPSMNILNFQQLKQKTRNKLMRYEDDIGVKSKTISYFNKKIKGLRSSELTILSGGTGSGKTTLLSQLSMDFCMQGVRTLWGSFQITNQSLLMTMLHQFSQKNIIAKKQLFDFYSQQFEKLPFYFLSFFGSTDPDKVLATIKYAVEKYDINFIVLDTLQFMLSGQADGFRKFQLQDQVVAALRQIATQKKCHIALVIHPRKYDQNQELGIQTIFGTAKSTQQADNVWIIQTRQQGFKIFDIKKNRFDGDVGRGYVGFNKQTKSYFQLRRWQLQALIKQSKTIEQIIKHRYEDKSSPDIQTIKGQDEELTNVLKQFQRQAKFKRSFTPLDPK